MTREEIENLKVGDLVQRTYETVNGKALPTSRYSKPVAIVEIFARGYNSVNGKAYVCFYTDFGDGARMSGSVGEGEEFIKMA